MTNINCTCQCCQNWKSTFREHMLENKNWIRAYNDTLLEVQRLLNFLDSNDQEQIKYLTCKIKNMIENISEGIINEEN